MDTSETDAGRRSTDDSSVSTDQWYKERAGVVLAGSSERGHRTLKPKQRHSTVFQVQMETPGGFLTEGWSDLTESKLKRGSNTTETI